MPHSGIDGSKPVCGSPSLIAAYHALHRLLAPRHPPCALSSLTIRTRNCHVLTSILKPESSKDCGQPAAISVNTHCECVVGKLPLQNIQLSKSPPSRPCGRFGATDSLALVRQLAWPARSLESRPQNSLAFVAPPSASERRGDTRRPSGRRPPSASALGQQTLVENTGLEPVTSWLQTRRSPS